jgi:hypothetical protein
VGGVGKVKACYKKKRKKRKKGRNEKKENKTRSVTCQVKGIPFAPSFFTVILVDGRVLLLLLVVCVVSCPLML